MAYQDVDVNLRKHPVYEIPISGNCGANTQLTVVSGIISMPFRILGARFFFPDTAINLVRAYLLHSQNDSTSTTGLPSGENIFSRFSPTAYFLGHDSMVKAECRIDIDNINTRIKLHINNQNAWASIIQAIVKIKGI